MTCKYGGCFSHQRSTKFSIGAQLRFGFCEEKQLNSLRFPLTRETDEKIANLQFLYDTIMDYGHPERAFISKIPNVWAWADKLG